MRITKWLGSILLAATCTTRADYSNTVMSFHPPGYWQLNETNVPAADAATNLGTVGPAGKGYYTAGSTHSVGGALAGNSDLAAAFDGSEGRVAVPFNSALGQTGPFTVEAWVQPQESPTSIDFAGTLGCVDFAGSGRLGWILYQSESVWNLRFGNTNGYTFSQFGTNVIQAGTWEHLAIVYDGTNAILYVNGVVDISGAVPNFTPNTAAPLEIGGAAGVDRFNNMSADEVAVYTNALSQAAIIAHYQNGIDPSPTVAYETLVLSNNPAIYLRLDEPDFVPGTPPGATNLGTLGAIADGLYQPGSLPGIVGVSYTGLGANNRACKFNGIQSYLDMGTDTGLDLQGPMSLVAWVKGNPADSRFQCVLGRGDTSWRLAMTETGRPAFADGQENPDVTGTFSINDGKWHHLAGVYDGGRLYLYVDGVSNASVPAVYAVEGSTDGLVIGAAPDYTDRYFAGAVDDVAVFTNALSASEVMQIFVAADVPPMILRPPLSQTIGEGLSFTLSVAAIGTPALTYQWIHNGTNLPDATDTELVMSNVVAGDAGTYTVQVSNAFGAVLSAPAMITIQSGPPILYQDPQSLARYTGAPVSFSVSAGGTAPLLYQWYFNGSLIVGATSSNYSITNVLITNAGDYSCEVTNSYGAVNSQAATLTVAVAPTCAYAQAVLADGPDGFWRLGEISGTTAYDYTGGHHGEYTNVTLGQPGYSVLDADTAAAFGPAKDSFVGNIEGISYSTINTTAVFSVEAWVKCPFGQGGNLDDFNFDVGIVAKGTGGGGEQFSLDLGSNGGYRFLVRDAAGVDHKAESDVIPDNTWQHVVGVCDELQRQLRLYVNGVNVASASIVAGVLDTSHPVTIGSRQYASGPYDLNLNGMIDDVAIYGHALTAEQVEAHYNARYANNVAPVIGTPPAATTNYVSAPVTFTVDAAGTLPLAYQWRFNGTNLAGETGSSYSIPSLAPTDAGNYSVVVSNAFGTNLSATAHLTVLPIPADLDVSSGLVLHLRFDGDYLDSSGRSNNGTNVGATYFVNGPIVPEAVHYESDGNSSFNYVTLGSPADLQFSSNVNFSVAYWIRYPANDLSGDIPVLGNSAGATYYPGYVLAQDSGAWIWTLVDADENLVRAWGAGDSVNDGNWHHLAFTGNRTGNAITYLDGVPVDVRPLGHPNGSSVGNLDTGNVINIGQDATGSYDLPSIAADLDDLGVWRRVLSPLEVAGIYTIGANRGASFTAFRIMIAKVNGQIELSWSLGTLQSADEATDPFTDVTGATSPYQVSPTGPHKFFRLRQ